MSLISSSAGYIWPRYFSKSGSQSSSTWVFLLLSITRNIPKYGYLPLMQFGLFLSNNEFLQLKISFQYSFRWVVNVFNFQLTVKHHLQVRALDYINVVVSEKVGIPLTGLTTPVGCMSLLQLAVPSCPQSLCNRKFWWRFCVVTFLAGVFCGCRGLLS